MKRILIAEDDLEIAELERDYLEMNGFASDIAADGRTALEMGLEGQYALILLDVMLPEMDGYEVCRRLREKLDIPILMVTAKGESTDKILGLGLGADDYITKPFSIRELMARVKANIRRGSMGAVANVPQMPAADEKRLVIDKAMSSVRKDGKNLDLTQREFDLICFLAAEPGKIFSREILMERVWNYDGYVGDVRAVDVAVRRLREKLEDDPANPAFIVTKRGMGYYFAG